MKDYGMDQPHPSFLDRHGARIGAAICALSACLVISVCLLAFFCLLPGAVSDLQDRSSAVVAENTGAERP